MIERRRSFRQPTPAAKPFLYPRGTLLADIPPLTKGLTEMEYLDWCIEQWKKAKPIEVDEREVLRQFRAGDTRSRYGMNGIAGCTTGLFA